MKKSTMLIILGVVAGVFYVFYRSEQSKIKTAYNNGAADYATRSLF